MSNAYWHIISLGLAALMFGSAIPSCAYGAQDSAAELAAGEPAEVTVSVGQRDAISRIVFNRPSSGGYQVIKAGTLLQVRLSGRYRLNFGPLLATPLTSIGNPRVAFVGGDTVAEFDVPQQSSYGDSQSGSLLIIAITAQEGAEPILPRQPPPVSIRLATDGADGDNTDLSDIFGTGDSLPTGLSNSAAGNQDVPQERLIDRGPDASRLGQEAAGNDSFGKQSDDVLALDEDPLGIGNASREEVADMLQRERENAARMEIIGAADIDPNRNPVQVTVNPIDDGLSFTFAWPEPASLAAFERAGYLWLVFDRDYRLDPEGLVLAEKLAANRIDRIEFVDHPDALILRMRTFENQNFVVEQEQLNWIVSLKDTETRTRFPLVPERIVDDAGAHRLVVRATGIGRKVVVADPTIGDDLTIFPLGQEGRGLAREYQFSVVDFPQTAQGVLVVPLLDGLDVQRYSDQVTIASGGKIFAEDGLPDRAASIGLSDKLVDFEAWRAGALDEFRENVVGLQYRLSVADDEDLQDRRWDLARFFLAHGRAPEAYGLLQLMEADDDRLTEDRAFLMVLALTKYRLHRYNEAWRHLEHRSLANEQDADLWRAVLAEKRNAPRQTIDFYRRGKDIIGSYDPRDRVDIQLAVVRAAIAEGDYDLAQRELQLTDGLRLEPMEIERRDLHVAHLMMAIDQKNTGLAIYEGLSNSRDHGIAAAARLARINAEVDAGSIDPLSAIDEYDTLRYIWRDDDVEIEALDRLATIYEQVGKFAEALAIYRDGLSYLPARSRQRNFFQRQEGLFQDLFLGGKADSLPPVLAISLWYQFSELTPKGEPGNRMVRNLATRLVSVELFEQAAKLLEYQVKERVTGIARANIAANLARIYIRANQPSKALTVLRATREPNLLPEVEASRTRVEARALIDLSRFDEAEELLRNDLSAQAQKLLADIYWGSGQWERVIEINQLLLGDGWRRNEELDSSERMQLMRQVIAMSFIKDRAGLVETRRRYYTKMRGGSFATAFDQLTSDQDLTGKELGDITNKIADVERQENFLQTYKDDFEVSTD